MKKILSFITIILALILLLSSCGDGLKSSSKEKETVLKVNDFNVPYQVYRYCLLNTKRDIDGGKDSYWDTISNKDEMISKVKDNTYNSIKNIYVVLSLCQKYNISIDDQIIKEKVNAAVSKLQNNYSSTEEYVNALRASFLNDETYRFILGVTYCQEELYYAMIKAGDIKTDKEYMTSIANSDEIIRIKQILIKFDANGDGKEDTSREQKMTLAQSVLQKAKDGYNFDKLIELYGNDTSMLNNPDGLYISYGTRYEAFEKAAFSLKVDEVSDIVETKEGYSIIKRLEKDPDYLVSHINEISAEYIDCLFNRFINDELDKLTVTEQKAINKYTIFNVKMK